MLKNVSSVLFIYENYVITDIYDEILSPTQSISVMV